MYINDHIRNDKLFTAKYLSVSLTNNADNMTNGILNAVLDIHVCINKTYNPYHHG